MELQVLGIGNAFTSRYYNTSFLVRSQRLYLIDGPQALLRLLRERGIDPASINDIIISHVHGDHTSGFETLILWKKYIQRSRPTLYTSAKVYAELRDKFFLSFAQTFTRDLQEIVPARFDDYVDFAELREDGRTRLDEELEVEIRHNWHPTPTLGLKLLGPLGSIGISGDNCYRPELLEALRQKGILDEARYEKLAGNWLWRADLIYHEVERRGPTSHTLEKDLLALPKAVQKKIRLVHISDDFTEAQLTVAGEGETVTFTAPGRLNIRLP